MGKRKKDPDTFTVALVYLGLFSFVSGTGILGAWLRKHPSRTNAETSSRVMHFLFFAGLVTPGLLALLRPGLNHLDERVGLPPLPGKRFFATLGLALALPGLYLMAVSNKLLRALGNGANAFRLTGQLVTQDVYAYTRNPMSLGAYHLWASAGFIWGSRFVTLIALAGMIPAHIFFLKYFEELELELRFGQAYLEYKRKVPFLFPRFPIPKKQK